MTSKEKIKKDIALAFDFLRYIVAHPKELDKIPNNSVITFLDDNKTVIEKKKTPSPRKYVKVKKEFEVVSEPPAEYKTKKK